MARSSADGSLQAATRRAHRNSTATTYRKLARELDTQQEIAKDGVISFAAAVAPAEQAARFQKCQWWQAALSENQIRHSATTQFPNRTPKMKYACLAAALATTWLALPAEAARFATPNDRSIVISGRIDPGDEAHFLSSLSRLRRGGTIEVHLSSPGGSVLAAMKIADIVHRAGLTTQVPYRATCASACVLVFAAGVTRIADADATIAVHSVGMRGQADVDQEMVENSGTLAATTLMARIMSSYGAPPSVIGKMVATPTDEAAVLTRADLDAWNVRITRFVPGQEMPQAGEVARPRSDPPAAPSPIYPTQPSRADNVVKQRDARDRKLQSANLGREGCVPSQQGLHVLQAMQGRRLLLRSNLYRRIRDHRFVSDRRKRRPSGPADVVRVGSECVGAVLFRAGRRQLDDALRRVGLASSVSTRSRMAYQPRVR